MNCNCLSEIKNRIDTEVNKDIPESTEYSSSWQGVVLSFDSGKSILTIPLNYEYFGQEYSG